MGMNCQVRAGLMLRRNCFGVVGPKRAIGREPDTALAALKTGKILLTHATPNTGGAVDNLIVPEV
jgi:hypothetical protein